MHHRRPRAPRDERGVRELAGAYRQVEPFCHEIDPARRERQLDVDGGMRGDELRDHSG